MMNINDQFHGKGVLYINVLLKCRLTVFLIFFILKGFSQDLTFRPIQIPSKRVNCMIQDKDGCIWLGTSDGLIKYYGKSYKTYVHIPEIQNSLSSNKVQDIAEDSLHNIWIATNYGVNRLNYVSGEIRRFFPDSVSYSSFSNDVRDVIIDDANIVYLGTEDGLYKVTVDAEDSIHCKRCATDTIINSTGKQFSIHELYQTSDGTIWTGTWFHGLCKLEKDMDTVVSCMPSIKKTTKKMSIYTIEESDPGILILGTFQGKFHFFDTQKNIFIHKTELMRFIKQEDLENSHINSIVKDRRDHLWIASGNGLYVVDYKNLKLVYSSDIYRHKNNEITNYKDQASMIYESREGIVWVSYQDIGLEKYNPNILNFEKYRVSLKKKKATRDYITEIIEHNDNLWLGTWGGGLIQADRAGNILKRITFGNLSKTNDINIIKDFCQVTSGHLFLGTKNGLIHYDPFKNIVLNHYTADSLSSVILSDNSIFRLYNEGNDIIWIITQEETQKLNTIHNKLISDKSVEVANSGKSYVVFKDVDKNYIFGFDNKFIFYDTNTDTATTYFYNPNKQNTFCAGSVKCIMQDTDKKYWIGTQDGLSLFDKTKNIFTNFYQKDGLSSNMILDILEDKHNHVWILTNNGLSKYDKQNRFFVNYGENDGLSNKANNIRMNKLGYFYITDENGFYYIHPDSLHQNTKSSRVYITEFLMSGQKVPVDQHPLNSIDIQYRNKISLKYYENNIGFVFHAFDYTSPEKIQYAYKLDGNNDSWVYPGTNNTVNFQSLYPDDYTLYVKRIRDDSAASVSLTKLDILIQPPFWLTWWAYFIYAVLIALSIILFRFITLWRERERTKQEFEKREAKRVHELDKMKLDLFFNISHEIRTPLTLISGPLNQIAGIVKNDVVVKRLNVIRRNVKRLEAIINQILDIRRLEIGKYKPVLIRGNINVFLEDLLSSFIAYSENTDINFRIFLEEKQSIVLFSPDSLEKILSNILINAFKYTPQNGNVIFEYKYIAGSNIQSIVKEMKSTLILITEEANIIRPGDYLQFIVKDSGAGIVADEIMKIFDDFYQPEKGYEKQKKGYGIGLSYVRKLTKLLNGFLFVESYPKQGTTFVLFFPVDRNAFKGYELKDNKTYNTFDKSDSNFAVPQSYHDRLVSNQLDNSAGNLQQIQNESETRILVVDDNTELLDYLGSILKNLYETDFAVNGEEAFKTALDKKIDLIISDIMMPVMDGLEFCNKIKNDVRTCHIPVILLTARSSEEHKIQGIETGADDYISKPFNPELLLARIKNIIDSRKKIWKEISNQKVIVPEVLSISKKDTMILKKIEKIVEDNISEPYLNHEIICKETGVGKTQLYRKLRSLTNQSVTEFIRNIRLTKASQILQSGEKIQINELAYQLGFSVPSYFIRKFREKYGMPPKAYNKLYYSDTTDEN
jgi:signal transduction histidine kinase/DNA-binding response OmpR family regulator